MKKRYLIIIVFVIFCIIFHFLSINLTPILKQAANKEINRFCQMVINNTPFPDEFDHRKLIDVKCDEGKIATINFNTNYASQMGSKIVGKLDEIFVSLEEGTYKRVDNSFYQRKLEKISDDGGVIATLPLGVVTNNPFLANLGPKINIRYKTITAITSSVDKEIKDYGVNHVMVAITLEIKIKMLVILPFYNDEFNKTYDYPLTMEIIEGEVPKWYQN